MHRESRMCHNHTSANITLIVMKFLVIQRVRQNNINLKFLVILVIQPFSFDFTLVSCSSSMSIFFSMSH